MVAVVLVGEEEAFVICILSGCEDDG